MADVGQTEDMTNHLNHTNTTGDLQTKCVHPPPEPLIAEQDRIARFPRKPFPSARNPVLWSTVILLSALLLFIPAIILVWIRSTAFTWVLFLPSATMALVGGWLAVRAERIATCPTCHSLMTRHHLSCLDSRRRTDYRILLACQRCNVAWDMGRAPSGETSP